MPKKAFEIRAEWDGKAGVWWCSNRELPLTTEAPSFDQLVVRVLSRLLKEGGCTFVRAGKGSHEIWQSPITGR